MTRDRARKKAIRTKAPQGQYARTAREDREARGSGPFLTARLQQDVIKAFRAAGWPADGEMHAEGGQWSAWAGPVRSVLSRPGSDPGAHPDDAGLVDLTLVPEFTFSVPALKGGHDAMSLTLPGSLPPGEIVARVSRALAAARARAIGGSVNDAHCAACEDAYPASHLLAPTHAQGLRVCPACVFFWGLSSETSAPFLLARDIDRLKREDLSAPACWSAVAAVLSCAGGANVRRLVDDADGLSGGAEHWGDWRAMWIWLPPGERPEALAPFGAGAVLGSIVDAVDAAHPGLRDECVRQHVAAFALPADADPNEFLVDQVWPAAVAYAVACQTQWVERPAFPAPWHLLEALDEATVGKALDALGSALRGAEEHVVTTLGGLELVARALGWDPMA